ncbi:unnamed protein product [Spirodela intermedia]|uniref:Uncharacterized protein n=1 Tax=Spirodela intermedia TaxID=51605 RepID=A0A7I8IJG2_SPIIN|nr:unnamed protein product [Spirodela intermedia]CAA6658025.1 unnamed protein product [Spirodela intermedia]
MGRARAPCCEKVGLKKGSWSPAEDVRLIAHIQKHGHGNWRTLPQLAGLLRCGKSCRLRWINYLRPDIKRELYQGRGRHHNTPPPDARKQIASCLPGRTDNEIKNIWNTHLKKRVALTEKTKEPPCSPTSNSSVSSCCQSGSRGSGIRPAEEETSRVHPESSADDFVVIPAEDNMMEMWNVISSSMSAQSTANGIDLSMVPEPWDLFEDSPLFSTDKEVNDNRWIAYLERELDLPQTSAAPAAVEDYIGDPDAEKGGAMAAEIDPTASFFCKRPRSPSPSPSHSRISAWPCNSGRRIALNSESLPREEKSLHAFVAL